MNGDVAPGDTVSRIGVIGGGISGLACAHRLRELSSQVEVLLFEAGPRLGGVLHTERQAGFLLELSADSFITNVPWGIDLCQRLGIADQLEPTNPAERRALVLHGGKLLPVPVGFNLLAPGKLSSVLSTRLLSWRGKLRVLGEALVRRRPDDVDESLASFARRRLGTEAYEQIVQPLVAGIYTADAEQLSMSAALPRFWEMEKCHGSLLRGAWRERKRAGRGAEQVSGARYGLFVAPRQGISTLIDALASRLRAESVQCNALVQRVRRLSDGGWSLEFSEGRAPVAVDGLVVATSAARAASLLADVDGELSAELGQIPYAGSVIALVGYQRDQIRDPLSGFGVVIPEVERRRILAISFSSNKFAGRAPPGHVLLRVFLGGAKRPDLANAPEEQLRAIVEEELRDLLGVTGAPCLFRLARWGANMPQYHVGHLERLARMDQRLAALPGLRLASSAYQGVGIPHCIRSGEEAARLVLATAARG